MLRFNPTANPSLKIHQWARLQAYNTLSGTGPKGKRFLYDNIRDENGGKIFELSTYERFEREFRQGTFAPAIPVTCAVPQKLKGISSAISSRTWSTNTNTNTKPKPKRAGSPGVSQSHGGSRNRHITGSSREPLEGACDHPEPLDRQLPGHHFQEK